MSPAALMGRSIESKSTIVLCAIAGLALLASARSLSADTTTTTPTLQTATQPAPRIKKARLKGNKVIVTGEKFDDGAVILINGEAVKTTTDSESPTARLIAKKAGKRIELDTVFTITVRNSDGEESNDVRYFRSTLLNARVLPGGRDFDGAYLDVGEFVLTINLDSATTLFGAPNTLTRVLDVPPPSTAYWLYQAFQLGISRFYAEQHNGGEVPPILLYDVAIVVE